MSILVRKQNANLLLKKIITHIAEGKSATWSINPTTKEITHTPEQWKDQTYLVGVLGADNDSITFRFTMGKPNSEFPKTRDDLYPYFHGRFVSFLFNHFHKQFERVVATSDTATSPTPAAKPKIMTLPKKS